MCYQLVFYCSYLLMPVVSHFSSYSASSFRCTSHLLSFSSTRSSFSHVFVLALALPSHLAYLCQNLVQLSLASSSSLFVQSFLVFSMTLATTRQESGRNEEILTPAKCPVALSLKSLPRTEHDRRARNFEATAVGKRKEGEQSRSFRRAHLSSSFLSPPPTTTPSTYLIALHPSHSEYIALLVSFSESSLTLYTSLSLSSNSSSSSSRLALLPSLLDLLSVGAAAMRRNTLYGKRADGSVQKSKAPRPYGQALVPLGRKASTQEQVSSASLPLLPSHFRLTFSSFQVQAENDWDIHVYNEDDPDDHIVLILVSLPLLLILRASKKSRAHILSSCLPPPGFFPCSLFSTGA